MTEGTQERQLGAADEERLELLGAITQEIRSALKQSPDRLALLEEVLAPHLQLLRHLSSSKVWVN